MENAKSAPARQPAPPQGWTRSCLWLALAVTCFHAAYTSLQFPAAGLMIFGYALALVRLTHQPSVRRAFYFGLAAGFLCGAPQLWFFFKIFNLAAVVLWLVLAFWTGLFCAIASGAIRRWGLAKAVWLIPVVWTGLEYFRSELYYLKFSWLNLGYAAPPFLSAHIGMYGLGFLFVAVAAATLVLRAHVVAFGVFVLMLFWAATISGTHPPPPPLTIVGIQTEFPAANLLPKVLTQALAKNTNAQIFVLSEYTLDGPVPATLKNWCRDHSRFLVVGGEAPANNGNYYNTAFVVDTNGDVVFQQAKSVPIQFFRDGLPAPEQKVWDSPWGKIGFCICYDLSYTRVTDELVRQGAQLLIVPTMDVEYWGRHQHELHARVAPVRATEYGIPIFRLASSGISQAVLAGGSVVAQAPFAGNDVSLAASFHLPSHGSLPLDRFFAPLCTGVTVFVTAALIFLPWKERKRSPLAAPAPAGVGTARPHEPNFSAGN
jgi:apolipoprotein N-acyltransferase